MEYESETRFIARMVGHAVLATLALLMMLLWWFTATVEDGTPEETYLLVVLTFAACIFLVCFAAHVVIQFRLEEADKRWIEHTLGHTITKPKEYGDDEQGHTEEYAAEG